MARFRAQVSKTRDALAALDNLRRVAQFEITYGWYRADTDLKPLFKELLSVNRNLAGLMSFHEELYVALAQPVGGDRPDQTVHAAVASGGPILPFDGPDGGSAATADGRTERSHPASHRAPRPGMDLARSVYLLATTLDPLYDEIRRELALLLWWLLGRLPGWKWNLIGPDGKPFVYLDAELRRLQKTIPTNVEEVIAKAFGWPVAASASAGPSTASSAAPSHRHGRATSATSASASMASSSSTASAAASTSSTPGTASTDPSRPTHPEFPNTNPERSLSRLRILLQAIDTELNRPDGWLHPMIVAPQPSENFHHASLPDDGRGDLPFHHRHHAPALGDPPSQPLQSAPSLSPLPASVQSEAAAFAATVGPDPTPASRMASASPPQETPMLGAFTYHADIIGLLVFHTRETALRANSCRLRAQRLSLNRRDHPIVFIPGWHYVKRFLTQSAENQNVITHQLPRQRARNLWNRLGVAGEWLKLFFWPNNRYAARHAIMIGIVSMVCLLDQTSPFVTENRGSWVLITLIVVSGPTAGESYFTGVFRIVGTLVGALWAAAVGYIAPGSPYTIVFLSWPLVACALYILMFSSYAYAGIVMGVTYMTILVPVFQNLPPVLPLWHVAVARFVNITIGILLAWAASWLLFPTFAKREVRRGVANLLLEVSELYAIENAAFMVEADEEAPWLDAQGNIAHALTMPDEHDEKSNGFSRRGDGLGKGSPPDTHLPRRKGARGPRRARHRRSLSTSSSSTSPGSGAPLDVIRPDTRPPPHLPRPHASRPTAGSSHTSGTPDSSQFSEMLTHTAPVWRPGIDTAHTTARRLHRSPDAMRVGHGDHDRHDDRHHDDPGQTPPSPRRVYDRPSPRDAHRDPMALEKLVGRIISPGPNGRIA
ncbi:hypothetical protein CAUPRSCDRAFT_11792 [Caulochytrium protostelioides]|uniref:Integral membrane bound transporter domain-containing protein n=1 Tax=Caulochytrium protostelioides TaxID=1555241 RepID=A0A4P9WTI8_9FUNG|nr:hypothetical protein CAUPRSCDRAFT_11792 [Caulochytrium protostelioides]